MQPRLHYIMGNIAACSISFKPVFLSLHLELLLKITLKILISRNQNICLHMSYTRSFSQTPVIKSTYLNDDGNSMLYRATSFATVF
jgi:hypothetical protein